MLLPYLAYVLDNFVRVERILVKKLGEKSDSISGTFLFFSLGTVFLIPALFYTDILVDYI
jgi:hypothetical protein